MRYPPTGGCRVDQAWRSAALTDYAVVVPFTDHFGFAKPDEDADPFDCGTFIPALADSMDLILPKVGSGPAAPPVVGVRDGDFYFQHSP